MKKNSFKNLNNNRTLRKILAGFVIAAAISSCKKDNSVATNPALNYEGQWKNVVPSAPAGPLDYFTLAVALNNGGTGTLDAAMIQPGYQYPKTNLSWQKITGDSVVVTMDIPAYPNEKWELRGLANGSSTAITADYYSIPNNNPAGKHKYGTFILNKY